MKPKKRSMYEKQMMQPTISKAVESANRKFSMIEMPVDELEEK